MDFFPRFAQTKNTMNMRTVLLLLLCCISSIAVADSLKEIELNRKETQMRPLSIMSEPAAYQTDAVINIRLPDASPYVTVTASGGQPGRSQKIYGRIYGICCIFIRFVIYCMALSGGAVF